MAEAILNHIGKDKFHARSAGSSPIGFVHPWVFKTLQRYGIPTTGYYSKSWDDFARQPVDIVITVCDIGPGEYCPVFPGKPIRAHWNTTIQTIGSDVQQATEFERVYFHLDKRIRAMLKLPMDKMSKAEISEKLNEIGKQN